LLGYLNPEALGWARASAQLCARTADAIARIGRQLKLDETDSAYGIHLIANATMLRALRAISSERGRDPAKFALLAIGGNGRCTPRTLAEAGGLTHVVVPAGCGVVQRAGHAVRGCRKSSS
jgi:N-methylhydantoinase A